MKKIIAIILSLCLFSNIAFADNCDWSKINKLSDGGYEYNPTLNLCVGNLVEQNKIQAQQLQDYQKAISLKDLAIKDDDSRIQIWQKTSDDEMDRVNKLDSSSKTNQWIFFSLGVLTVIGSGFLAARLMGK